MRALNDRTQLVVSSARCLLLPVLCAWAYQLERLEDTIVAYFLEQTLVCIKVDCTHHTQLGVVRSQLCCGGSPAVQQVSHLEGESGATECCIKHLQTLTHMVSWHVAAILMSAPFAAKAFVEPHHSPAGGDKLAGGLRQEVGLCVAVSDKLPVLQ